MTDSIGEKKVPNPFPKTLAEALSTLPKPQIPPRLKVPKIPKVKVPIYTPEVELPSLEDFQNAYLTDDISQARLHVHNVLQHFMVNHCISTTKNAPIKLFIPMCELLEKYGIEMKKATPVTREICLFTFTMNPDKLPAFQAQ